MAPAYAAALAANGCTAYELLFVQG